MVILKLGKQQQEVEFLADTGNVFDFKPSLNACG